MSFLPSFLPSFLISFFGTLPSGFRGKPVVYVCPFSCTSLYSGDLSSVLSTCHTPSMVLYVFHKKKPFFEDALSLFFDKVISFIGDCCAAVVYTFPYVQLTSMWAIHELLLNYNLFVKNYEVEEDFGIFKFGCASLYSSNGSKFFIPE